MDRVVLDLCDTEAAAEQGARSRVVNAELCRNLRVFRGVEGIADQPVRKGRKLDLDPVNIAGRQIVGFGQTD